MLPVNIAHSERLIMGQIRERQADILRQYARCYRPQPAEPVHQGGSFPSIMTPLWRAMARLRLLAHRREVACGDSARAAASRATVSS
jgi:hypothetical protein